MTDLLTPGEPAPDFELTDVKDRPVRLTDYRDRQIVVVAFLRGFM